MVFNIKRIEQAIKEGDFKTMGGVPVVDGRHGSKYTRYIPVPNSPHGCNAAPDGIHLVLNGKLAHGDGAGRAHAGRPVRRQDRRATAWWPSRSWAWARCTAFDGRGNAYTTLFIDSQMVKWNIDLAKRAFKGEKVDPIIQKLDVHYQPGHNHSTMGETREADGKWLVSLNKFSKDRFLNVGPLSSRTTS